MTHRFAFVRFGKEKRNSDRNLHRSALDSKSVLRLDVSNLQLDRAGAFCFFPPALKRRRAMLQRARGHKGGGRSGAETLSRRVKNFGLRQ